MELKQNDPAKTALSPIQTSYYYLQFQKLAKEDDKLSLIHISYIPLIVSMPK